MRKGGDELGTHFLLGTVVIKHLIRIADLGSALHFNHNEYDKGA